MLASSDGKSAETLVSEESTHSEHALTFAAVADVPDAHRIGVTTTAVPTAPTSAKVSTWAVTAKGIAEVHETPNRTKAPTSLME